MLKPVLLAIVLVLCAGAVHAHEGRTIIFHGKYGSSMSVDGIRWSAYRANNASAPEPDKIVFHGRFGTSVSFDGGLTWHTESRKEAAAPASDVAQVGLMPQPLGLNGSIQFELTEGGPVTLEFFDLLGRSAATVLQLDVRAGAHRLPFTTPGLPSGAYLWVLKGPGLRNAGTVTISN